MAKEADKKFQDAAEELARLKKEEAEAAKKADKPK